MECTKGRKRPHANGFGNFRNPKPEGLGYGKSEHRLLNRTEWICN